MKPHDPSRSGLVFALLLLVAAALAIVSFVIVSLLSFLALAGSGSSFVHVLTGGRTIDVVVYTGGKRVDHQIPALNGATVGYSGGWAYTMPGKSFHVHTDENYRVDADTQGRFTVTMHRVVQQDDATTATDNTLPVWSSEPGADKRIKLPDGSSVAAYFTKSSH
ncbi:MAG TPA: hypothetical protein VHY09_07990 [Candidatus Methylacidiphilales bacterium]|nr:hypothetical protein [Candidatus Methylacidiphilales bacterium]